MNEQVLSFQQECSNVISECDAMGFMTRAKELQIFAIENLREQRSVASVLKQTMIEAQDEDAANALLSVELLIDSLTHFLEMWVALKDDDPDKAWHCLVAAQMAATNAM